jgi:molybdate/tungstate transport system substrate-binding protein
MKKVAAILIAVAVLGIIAFQLTQGGPTLQVFHAGSLAKPLGELEELFENQYGVDVQREPSGSVIAVRKVTELGKSADIVAVADYSLIRDMMIPEYADWYIKFARNEMVITYTTGSEGASEIDENNWYEILGQSGVRFGFANPNDDPCGYRSVMVAQLAEIYYDNSTIFDDLIAANSEITASQADNTWSIEVPPTEDLNPDTEKVRIESKSMDLLNLLEAGSIDYAFEYLSVAVQYGFEFVELPAEINLGEVEQENVYSRVEVQLEDEDPITAKPIVYGVTIPRSAEHEEDAVNFVKLLITEDGQQVFEELGQPPIVPAVADNAAKLPDELQGLVSA